MGRCALIAFCAMFSTGGPALAQEKPRLRDIVLNYATLRGDLVEPHKPNIVGRDFVVSGPDFTTTRVVYDVFMRGGTIWDAAIPGMWMTMIAAEQMLPGTSPFTLYNAEEGKVYAYMGVGTAAGVATIDYYKERGHSVIPASGWDGGAWLRMGVPSEPDGMLALLERFGTMSFTEVMKDVLELMQKGYPISTAAAHSINNSPHRDPKRASDAAFIENRAHFLQHGRPVDIGDVLVDKGLARTLWVMIEAEQRALAAGATREEGIRAARDAFYKGEIARAVHEFVQGHGGTINYSDYASYRGRWFEQRELPHTNYLGIDFWVEPTYTQSGLYVLYYNMLKHFDLYEIGYMTADYIHLISQIMALAMADRWQWFGDPAFVDVPAGLWSEEYASQRVKLIDLTKPFDGLPPPGDPIKMSPILEGWEEPKFPTGVQTDDSEVTGLATTAPAFETAFAKYASGGAVDTISLSIIDGKGNVFNYCPSDGRTGAVPMLPGYGFGLSMRTRQFTLLPGHAGAIAPGKRVVSTPHTFVGTKNGQGYLASATVSGDQQTQGVLQAVLNHVVWGMNPQVAVEQPRWVQFNYLSHFTPHNNTSDPKRLLVEKAVPEEVVEELRNRGWKVDRRTNWATAGSITFIIRDPVSGMVVGGSNVLGERYTYGR